MRTGDGQDHFDLLPFVAILMGLLGTLLLVTLGLAALRLSSGQVPEVWCIEGGAKTRRMTPVLVEWDGTQAVVHEGDARITVPWQVPAGPAAGTAMSAAPQRLLNIFTERKGTHYALFAVRPAGFATFRQMAQRLRANNIAIGYEPLPAGRAIRLQAGDYGCKPSAAQPALR
jgi:hypothetical protein